METREIMNLRFSTSLIQEYCTQSGNEGIHYYATQVGALASYLSHRFLGVRTNLVGISLDSWLVDVDEK